MWKFGREFFKIHCLMFQVIIPHNMVEGSIRSEVNFKSALQLAGEWGILVTKNIWQWFAKN
jgi:hypothetical protein